MENIRRIIRKGVKKVKGKLYDLEHKNEAYRAYNSLIRQNGADISTSDKKRIKEYSIEVLGSEAFAPWLYVFTAYQGKFKEGWMPDNYFGRIIMPLLNQEYRSISDVKTLSKRLLITSNIPDIAYYVNNSWFDAAGNEYDIQGIKKELFSNNKEVFIKLDNSSQGRGIIKSNSNTFDEIDFSKTGDFVVQRPIAQHKWFKQIVDGSVGTVRITTVKMPLAPAELRASFMKVGRAVSEYVTSSEGIKIPVIDQQGSLGEGGMGPGWKKLVAHPDTGFIFKGQTIPRYTEAVKLCLDLHNKLPHFAIIGWDIAISDDNHIEIIEWNTNHPGIKYNEAFTGPCFKGLGWESYWKKKQN